MKQHVRDKEQIKAMKMNWTKEFNQVLAPYSLSFPEIRRLKLPI